MPTAASWTEAVAAVGDVGHLLRFRSAAIRRHSGAGRSAGWLVGGLAAGLVGLTAAVAVAPAYVPGAGRDDGRALDVLLLLPTALAGFLLLALVSAVASGGGRELLSREHAVTFPLSPTTDHLGALLLAPLNIAWLLQAWTLLGATAYAVGRAPLLPAQLGVLCWLGVATAVAQVVAWSVEGVRRGPHGVATVRIVGALLVAAAIALQLGGHLTAALDRAPTRWVVAGLVDGWSGRWALTAAGLVLATLVAVALGAVPAHLAARRAPHDEQRVESERHAPRRAPGSVLAALVRVDRASVWRAVPMRRGLAVLALGPGAVALAGDLPWVSMTVLPGLVASGGALLFGVNAWCLDGRGGLWRESLPVPPATVFAARVLVLAEFLVVASAVTLALASLRAGTPTASELAALLGTWLVVVVQVVAAAMRWSDQRPYAVDLRSARATPAPPLAMVGYSVRLAVCTSLTGLVFSGLARVPDWRLSLLVAVPFLAWSLLRLLRTRARWLDPVARARVVTTVAA